MRKKLTITNELALAYQQMAADTTEEQEANEWIESLVSDAFN